MSGADRQIGSGLMPMGSAQKGGLAVDIRLGRGGYVLRLPGYWQGLRSLPDDPPGTRAFAYQADASEAMMLVTPVDEGGYFMPFDKAAVLRGIRLALAQTGSGLIAVETGRTATGLGFVYTIVKALMEPSGVQYTLTWHAELPDRVQIQGYFSERGTTGVRDTAVLEMKRRDGTVTLGESGLRGWMRDPYDDSADGFLMNLSEAREYDALFPMHPLTQARALVAALDGI